MNFFTIIIVSSILINPVLGQVCCSLVGSVDPGYSKSSKELKSHWPSIYDNKSSFKWSSTFNTRHTSDQKLNIRYNAIINVQGQLSHYVGKRTIGYLKIDNSWMEIEEYLSFSNSSSNVNLFRISTGFRHLLRKNRGFVFGEISFPKTPTFTNLEFPFKTGSVSTLMAGFSNKLQMPWKKKFPLFLSDLTSSVTLSKNTKNQNNVF